MSKNIKKYSVNELLNEVANRIVEADGDIEDFVNCTGPFAANLKQIVMYVQAHYTLRHNCVLQAPPEMTEFEQEALSVMRAQWDSAKELMEKGIIRPELIVMEDK